MHSEEESALKSVWKVEKISLRGVIVYDLKPNSAFILTRKLNGANILVVSILIIIQNLTQGDNFCQDFHIQYNCHFSDPRRIIQCAEGLSQFDGF